MLDVLEYLKKVGFKKVQEFDGKVEVVSNTDNYRFPTLSCRLNEMSGTNESGGTGMSGASGSGTGSSKLIFVLSYFVSDDFSKQSLEFSFEDWYNYKRGSNNVSLFDVISKNLGFNFFDFFSITESSLTKIFQSRLKGRKAWKKRNWPLSIRWANVYKAFGLSGKYKGGVSGIGGVGLNDLKEEIARLDSVMNNCVSKAAKDFSYMPFDLFYDCYKKKLSLKRKLNDADSVSIDNANVTTRVSRDKVFREFANAVVLLQKG